MDCAYLINNMCGYCYLKKGVYVPTARRYFWGLQQGPVWKCIYPKNRPTKNASNHSNL